MPSERMLFLGLDCSTQSFKAVITEAASSEVLLAAQVNFDDELGQYAIKGGMTRHDDGRVTSPVIMWVHALDIVLEKLQAQGLSFADIVGVSGSGQQHGSVYWAPCAESDLGNMDAALPLRECLANSFQIADSPIWADSTTQGQCKRLEYHAGGALTVAQITGSRAYERFTGNQIARLAERRPTDYSACSHISLVSSALASIFLGAFASIDYSDGSGMNLMDIHTQQWWERGVTLTAPELHDKLGDLVASHAVLGNISTYFCDRYGFCKTCKVVVWSGDNPNSFASLGLRSGDVAISLGTSDTLFAVAANPTPGTQGHVFVNPVLENSFMVMLCYKNGSLTREAVRDDAGIADWDTFEQELVKAPPGNGGLLGIFLDEKEITPHTAMVGRHVYTTTALEPIERKLTASETARALAESRFVSMRAHCASLGVDLPPKRVIVTGGGSRNHAMLQVAADVLGCPVYTTCVSESAALGAALRAEHAVTVDSKVSGGGEGSSTALLFGDVVSLPEVTLVCEPHAGTALVYAEMVEQYRCLEERVLLAHASSW